MTSSTDSGDVAANSTTSFIVAVPYQGTTTSYAQVLRMGAWSGGIEDRIVDSSGDPLYNASDKNTAYKGDDPLQDSGVLLYSADQTTIYSPTIRAVGQVSSSSWSNQNMTVTTDGSDVVAYSFAGFGNLVANYQKLNTISMTAGYSANFILGGAMTVWTGNDASTGLGGLLWSNVGLTQNIFDGQVVNINGSDFNVQGIGAVSLGQSASLLATRRVEIAANTMAGYWSLSAQELANFLSQLSRFATVAAGGLMPAAIDALTLATTSRLGEGEKKIESHAQIEFDTAGVISTLIIAVQALTSLTGIMMSVACRSLVTGTIGGKLVIDAFESKLSCGLDSHLSVGDSSIAASAPKIHATAPFEIEFTCGIAAITMTPEGLILRAGFESGIEISDAGVRIVGLLNRFE